MKLRTSSFRWFAKIQPLYRSWDGWSGDVPVPESRAGNGGERGQGVRHVCSWGHLIWVLLFLQDWEKIQSTLMQTHVHDCFLLVSTKRAIITLVSVCVITDYHIVGYFRMIDIIIHIFCIVKHHRNYQCNHYSKVVHTKICTNSVFLSILQCTLMTLKSKTSHTLLFTHTHTSHTPSQVLTALRSQLEFPAQFTERLPNEVVSIVRLLLATDPTKRPTALEMTTLKTLQSLEKKVRKSKREYIPVF